QSGSAREDKQLTGMFRRAGRWPATVVACGLPMLIMAAASPATYAFTGEMTGSLDATKLADNPFTQPIADDSSARSGLPDAFVGIAAITNHLSASGIANVEISVAANQPASGPGFIDLSTFDEIEVWLGRVAGRPATGASGQDGQVKSF